MPVFDRFTIDVAGGRKIAVLTTGPADSVPLVFHTGTPSGLVPFARLTAAATARGLRTVLYSRPGYGDSDPMLGRRVADAAADVAAIIDQLAAGGAGARGAGAGARGADAGGAGAGWDGQSFVTAGWSGGGPHALACAALLPDRCLAAASI